MKSVFRSPSLIIVGTIFINLFTPAVLIVHLLEGPVLGHSTSEGKWENEEEKSQALCGI